MLNSDHIDLKHAETWNLLALLIGGGILVLALVLEHLFGQEPCSLCLTQRYCMTLGLMFSVVSLFTEPRLGILPVLAMMTYLGGIGFVVYQIYLQLNPEAAADCGAPVNFLIENEFGWRAIAQSFFRGSTECGEPSLIPTLSGLAFVVLIVVTGLQLYFGPRSSY